jgi:hypothetical protein
MARTKVTKEADVPKKAKRKACLTRGQQAAVDKKAKTLKIKNKAWQVQEIFESRMTPEGEDLLVSWKGWKDGKERTWIPLENMQSNDLLHAFRRNEHLFSLSDDDETIEEYKRNNKENSAAAANADPEFEPSNEGEEGDSEEEEEAEGVTDNLAEEALENFEEEQEEEEGKVVSNLAKEAFGKVIATLGPVS